MITGKPVKECSNIKVKFSYHDLPGSRKKEIAEDVAWFKEVRTKEGLKHLYDDYIASSANIGVFYVLDDSRMYTSATKGHMKLVKDISSNGELQEEDEILAVMIMIIRHPGKEAQYMRRQMYGRCSDPGNVI